MKYVLTLGSHGRSEKREGQEMHVVYRKGDEIELTAAEAASATLKGRIEPVGKASEKKAS